MKKIVALAFVVAFFTQTLHAIDLPKPPSGFTWQQVPELQAALLKPEGWFFKQEYIKGGPTYFITQESPSESGEFSTGLTLQAAEAKVTDFADDSAVKSAKAMIDQMAAKHHVKTWSRAVGSLREFGCEFKDTDASGTIVVRAFNIVDLNAYALYMFTFKSPAANWDAAWRLGHRIMDTWAIHDEIHRSVLSELK